MAVGSQSRSTVAARTVAISAAKRIANALRKASCLAGGLPGASLNLRRLHEARAQPAHSRKLLLLHPLSSSSYRFKKVTLFRECKEGVAREVAQQVSCSQPPQEKSGAFFTPSCFQKPRLATHPRLEAKRFGREVWAHGEAMLAIRSPRTPKEM